jgi:hypothetical protein
MHSFARTPALNLCQSDPADESHKSIAEKGSNTQSNGQICDMLLWIWSFDERTWLRRFIGVEFIRPNITFSAPKSADISLKIPTIVNMFSNINADSSQEIDVFERKMKRDDGLVVSKGTEKHSNE